MHKSRFYRIKIFWLLIAGFLSTFFGFSSPNPIWLKIGHGINESEVTAIVIQSQSSQILYAATPRGVYKSVNQGQSFTPIPETQGFIEEVNYLYIYDQIPQEVYIATESGVFLFDEYEEDWAKIYQSSHQKDRFCTAVVTDEKNIYIATLNGVFYRPKDETVFSKLTGELSQKATYTMIQDHENIYLGTSDQVFRVEKTNHTQRKIFSLVSREMETGDSSEEASEEVLSQELRQIRSLAVSLDAKAIYLATSQGVSVSQNQGESWKDVSLAGLPSNKINSIFIDSQNEIFVGTSEGVFLFKGQHWEPLYAGMESCDVNTITGDEEGNIFAATKKGVFRLQNGEQFQALSRKEFLEMKNSFKNEPSIQDVQKMAIEYADVNPKKIQNWRALAKQKALLPNLSVGVDRSATELLHWDTGSSPDKLTKGREYIDWDISVSWNLGDLIWSSDQTSIDSRSKLMVELRDDILDQITRLYFERRRLQTELFLADNLDTQAELEKQMRIEELTALIDAMTGGEFSRRIEEFYNGKN